MSSAMHKKLLQSETIPSAILLSALFAVQACAGEGTLSDPIPTMQSPDAGLTPNDAGPRTQDAASHQDPPTTTCDKLRVEATSIPARTMIVLDQSSSMNDENRWNAAREAMASVVTELQGSVAFGMVAYGTSRSCGSTSVDFVSAPRVGNAETILDYMDSHRPIGPTPTARALRLIAERSQSDRQDISSVILVTDGAPNCNYDLDPKTCVCSNSDLEACARLREEQTHGGYCLDDDATVAAVQALRQLGIETHVIGYSVVEWADVLDRMAAAGSGGRYIPVENAIELEASLASVAGGISTCSFELNEPPQDQTYVRVALNEREVLHSSQVDAGGWELDDKTVRLLGSDCEEARTNPGAVLDVAVECEQVFVIR